MGTNHDTDTDNEGIKGLVNLALVCKRSCYGFKCRYLDKQLKRLVTFIE